MNKRNDDKLTTDANICGPDTIGSMSGISELQTDVSRSGKISSRYFAIMATNKNLAGRSTIRVLVVRSSQIRVLKKHARSSLQ